MREIAHIRATMLGRFALQQTGMKEPGWSVSPAVPDGCGRWWPT